MHTTALCSPSRSCIVTGRNHHANGMAAITELATGYPGYNGVMPLENGMLSEILVERGYSTLMVGKWHLTPSTQETAAGPYDRWPLGRGFQRFYGFLGGDTSQWYPDLVYDNHQVEPPKTPEEGYHLSEDLVDKAVSFIADTQAGRSREALLPAPLLRRDARPSPRARRSGPTSTRARSMTAGTRIARRSSRARRSSASSPRTPSCHGTTPTSPIGTRCPRTPDGCTAGIMEVFAGFLSHTDHQIGRLLEFLTKLGELDNTLIMVISDNGASAEGGPGGTTNEAQFFNNAQEPIEESLARIDEIGGPHHLQPLPVGLDLGGQHPVPPLEARDLPRRLVRSVHRLVAEADRGAR